MKIIVVIAKYKESTSWVKDINIPFIIFNKNRDDDHFFEHNLPNKGFETDTFLHYIINNYESLPDYVVFLQGNPFDHCHNVLELISHFNFNVPFVSLGPEYIRDGGPLEETINWANFCNIEINDPIKFISGAQCIVSRDLIKKRTKESYKEIHGKVCRELNFNSHTKYYFEYLWPTILGFNEMIKI